MSHSRHVLGDAEGRPIVSVWVDDTWQIIGYITRVHTGWLLAVYGRDVTGWRSRGAMVISARDFERWVLGLVTTPAPPIQALESVLRDYSGLLLDLTNVPAAVIDGWELHAYTLEDYEHVA